MMLMIRIMMTKIYAFEGLQTVLINEDWPSKLVNFLDGGIKHNQCLTISCQWFQFSYMIVTYRYDENHEDINVIHICMFVSVIDGQSYPASKTHDYQLQPVMIGFIW